MFWHPPHVFPILLLQSAFTEIVSRNSHLWEAHHVEDSVQLVMVVRVAGLYILLPDNFNNLERVQRNKENVRKQKVSNFSPAMEDWFTGEKLSEYAANGPNVDCLKRNRRMKVIFKSTILLYNDALPRVVLEPCTRK